MTEPTLMNNEGNDLNPQLVNVIESLVQTAMRFRIPKMDDVNNMGLKHQAYDLKPMTQIYSREMNGVATDLVVNDFTNSPEKTYNFMNIICIFFNQSIEYYCELKGLQKSTIEKPGDIYFMYKGGNVLRLLYNEFKKNIPVTSISIADDFFAKSFKKSDSDFSIIVNPELDNYEQVFDDMVSLSYVLQTIIRKLFNRQPKGDMFDVFAFTEYNNEKKDLILRQFLNDLNSTQSVQDETNPDFYGARFTKVKVMGHTYELEPVNDAEHVLDEEEVDEDMVTVGQEKRVDFGIDKCNTNQICVYSLTSPEDSDYLYISANRALDFETGTPEKPMRFKFTLVRTKLNATAYMTKDGEKKVKMLGGEVIDCTVIHKESMGNTTIEEFEHNKEHISKYSLSLPGTKYRLDFFGYNLDGLVHDLELILYETVDKPWEDMKYAKRINRLFFLYMVDLFRNVLDNDQRIEKVQKFRVGVIEHLRRGLDMDNREEYLKHAKGVEIFDPEIALSVSAKEFERIAAASFDDKDGLRGMLDTVDQNTKSMVDILNDTQKYINSDGNYLDSVYQGSVSSMAGGMAGGANLPDYLAHAAPPGVVMAEMPGTSGLSGSSGLSGLGRSAPQASMAPARANNTFAPQTNIGMNTNNSMTSAMDGSVLSHALSDLEADLANLDNMFKGLN
jgi:hypothetical protein